MPDASTVKAFTDLGTVGAALLLVFVFIILIFGVLNSLVKNKKKGEDSTIDRLCTKIDLLISTIADDRKEAATQQVSNSKDQQLLVELLSKVLISSADIQEKVTKIEVQTSGCLIKQVNVREVNQEN